MSNRHRISRASARGVALTGGLLLFLTLSTALPAAAADRGDRRYDRGRQSWRYDRHDHRRGKFHRHDVRPYDRGYRGRFDNRVIDRRRSDYRRFELPRSIRRHGDFRYRPYYTGLQYYAPHRHGHRIYSFPVWIDGHLSYSPFAYCEGNYFEAHFGGRRSGFSLHFDF